MTRREDLSFERTLVEEAVIEERVALLNARTLTDEEQIKGLRKALALLDLTTLEGADTDEKVRSLCTQARVSDRFSQLPDVAAICVYPTLVGVAKRALEGSMIKIASVAGGFPAGQFPLKLKLAETRFALDEGADEIDLVISRGKFLEGEHSYVYDEIAAVKGICGAATLKTIVETGELGNYTNVRLASDIAIAAGSDFIKTSTGKIQPAATLQATLVMAQAIRDHYSRTGKMIGLKPAGGIRKSGQALQYLMLVKEELGEKWIRPDRFRIGASTLAADIMVQLSDLEKKGTKAF